MKAKWGIIIAGLFTLSILMCLILNVSLLFGLAATLITSILILSYNGVSPTVTIQWIFEGVLSVKKIYLLILMIGMNVSMWIASGTVPMLIYFGFDVIGRVSFLPFAFTITAIVAFFLGTGLGTISTIGIALFTLGKTIGISEGLLVGALVSGAYFADRLSPISALVNFTLETVGVSFKNYFVRTAQIMIPTAVVSFIFYMALAGTGRSLELGEVTLLKESILDAFNISPFLLVLPFLVLWISFKGLKSEIVLGFGISTGFLIGVLYQQMSILDGFKFLIYGFKTQSASTLIQSLQIGGAMPMVEVVFIVMGGIAMSTLFEKCGWIEPIALYIKRKSISFRKAVFNTGVLSIVLDALTCDQTVGILIPGKYLKGVFRENKLGESDLAQVIANSGTAIAPLMPWNVNAIIILSITGVSAISFAPYAIMNWIAFIGTVLITRPKLVDKL